MVNNIEIPDLKLSELAQILIFKNLWHASSKKSLVSGLWLRTYINSPLWQNCFMRVLEGQQWRYFKYYYKNIVLVTPGERGLWMQGSEEERVHYSLTIEEQTRGRQTAQWNKIKDLEEILKIEYKKYFPSTKGMFINYHYTLEEQSEIIGRLNKKFLQSLK